MLPKNLRTRRLFHNVVHLLKLYKHITPVDENKYGCKVLSSGWMGALGTSRQHGWLPHGSACFLCSSHPLRLSAEVDLRAYVMV